MIKVYEKENVTCVKAFIEKEGHRKRIVYLYLVDGMLIDTGPQSIEQSIIPFLETADFDQVVLTHSHEDHSGLAPWIERHLDMPIYVHPKGVTICAEDTPYPHYRQEVWGQRAPFKAEPMEGFVHSRNEMWDVIHTPGHADDHVAFYNQKQKLLFTGDLYLAPKTKIILREESIPEIMSSIRTLLTYDFNALFCSHAGYVKNGREALREKLAYLENLTKQTIQLRDGGFSVEEIRSRLIPRKYPLIDYSQGDWDSLHIFNSILAEAE